MELLAHSTELYTSGKPRNFKFVILHLANSIELILKDRLIDKGISIYNSKQLSQTIGVWDAFGKLNDLGISIPERPVIELLIDDRNTIQHRFSFPNAESVYFYLEHVVTFLTRFLNDEYGLNLLDVLASHLSDKDLAFLGLSEKESEEEESAIDRLFTISPESAVIQAFNLIEHRFMKLLEVDSTTSRRPITVWRYPDFPYLMDELAFDSYLTYDNVRQFDNLRKIRNQAVHSAHFDDDERAPDWATGMALAKDILEGLDRAIKDDFVSKRRKKKQNSMALSTNNHDTEPEEDLDGDKST
jgi:hypothetical protein